MTTLSGLRSARESLEQKHLDEGISLFFIAIGLWKAVVKKKWWWSCDGRWMTGEHKKHAQIEPRQTRKTPKRQKYWQPIYPSKGPHLDLTILLDGQCAWARKHGYKSVY